MEEKINEQTEPKTQTAVAEEVKGEDNGEVSLGKFKDVQSLMSAYNSLESEFTKRCQKIKELESKLATDKAVTPIENEHVEKVQEREPIDKEKILKEYLSEVLSKKPTAIVMDSAGVGVKTPSSRPRNIEEAGNLVKNLLSKK